MKNLLTKLALSASLLTALSSPVFGEENYRIHSSVGYHKNVQILNGTDEKYNPFRFNLGFEFDKDASFFNKYEVSPFFGLSDGRYDFGIDFKLKKIFSQRNGFWSPFFYSGLGFIHLSKEFEEHKFKDNFNTSAGLGAEFRINKNLAWTLAADYGHISRGKKIWNSIKYRTTRADNEGNPGLNPFGIVVGLIYKLKKFK